MPMPSSGALKLFDAGKEVVFGAREAAIPNSTVLAAFPNGISLTEISTGTGAAADDPINWRSSADSATYSPPDGDTPHALSEFYDYTDGYVHEFDITNSTPGYQVTGYTKTYITADYLSGRISRGFTDPSNTDNIDPIAVSGYKWREFKFKVRNASGATKTYRPVIMFWANGTDYRRDFAVHSIRIGSTHYHATNETMKYDTNATAYSFPVSETGWSNVVLGSTAGRWNIEAGGGTPSSNTGPDIGVIYSTTTGNYETTTGRYWYYESSNSATGWATLKPTSTKTINNGAVDFVTFVYSAWSNDVLTWDNCYFDVCIQVVS
mgnify:CR=1 FL=1